MAVWIFFSTAPTVPNSSELKIHIINVAQDTSVYYSVPYTNWYDQMRNSYKRKYLPIHNTKFTVTLLLCEASNFKISASFDISIDWTNRYPKLYQLSNGKIISHFHLPIGPMGSTIGLTPWNQSCFEFKFDDTRRSS